MAIVKLVCQGCGANLDAESNSQVIQCSYCGTRNSIQQAQPQPQPPPPQQQHQPQVQISIPSTAHQAKAGKRVGMIITFAALLPVILGLGITFIAVKGAQNITDRVVEGIGGGMGGGGGAFGGAKFRWQSKRPFLDDVDGDGKADLVGLIAPVGETEIKLAAISGESWEPLWEVALGDLSNMPGQPKLQYLADEDLALFALGTTLHAYEAKTGNERWVANLPDKVEVVARDGDDKLWVRSIDESGNHVALADGKVSKAAPKPPDSATTVRSDAGYELIPSERTLDLESEQFDGLRVEAGFCPKAHQAIVPARGFGPKTCSYPEGLAFATRKKGSKVPFLVAYDRESKAEKWRVQLTKAGSLETVDTGFGQPRAEFFDGGAIISYVPGESDDARIRRISMKDGSTQWETTLTQQSTENVDGMLAGKDHVFVTFGGGIHVLKLSDGKEVTQIGGWF